MHQKRTKVPDVLKQTKYLTNGPYSLQNWTLQDEPYV